MSMQVIHIAGTNGKGSTAVYLADILSKKGKTGLFTSPHIFSEVERFKIDSVPMPQTVYEEYLRNFKEKENAGVWNLFKIWTDIAFDWFRKEQVEYAVIETGLGGIKDPTNKYESDMQIITAIDYDHTENLGTSLRKITSEKCGIIEWQSTVISQPQTKEAEDVIKHTCEHLDSRLALINEKLISIHKSDLDGTEFSFNQNGLLLKNAYIKSFSKAQIINACTAALAAFELDAEPNIIKESLRETYIPGRCEYRENVLIDTAHNPGSMARLADEIKRFFPKTYISVVTAVMKDKDAQKIAEIIDTFGDYIICTQADKKRGMPAKEYAALFKNAGADANPAHALLYARDMAEKKNGIVVVCGSFYLLSKLFDSSFLESSKSIVFL